MWRAIKVLKIKSEREVLADKSWELNVCIEHEIVTISKFFV